MVLVNLKLFILEKVNFGQPIKCWSNLVKLVKLNQTWSNALQLVVFGTGHYNLPPLKKIFVHEIRTCILEEMRVLAPHLVLPLPSRLFD